MDELDKPYKKDGDNCKLLDVNRRKRRFAAYAYQHDSFTLFPVLVGRFLRLSGHLLHLLRSFTRRPSLRNVGLLLLKFKQMNNLSPH